MITIENGIEVVIRNTREGIVLLLGDRTQPAPPTSVVVKEVKRRRRGGRHGTLVDSNGNNKWMKYTTAAGKVGYKKNPDFREENTLVEVAPGPALAHLGQSVHGDL